MAFPYSILFVVYSSSTELYLSFPSLSDVSAADSGMRYNIMEAKILKRFITEGYPYKSITSAMNGKRRMAFSGAQYPSFVDLEIFPTVAQRMTSVTGRKIFSLALAKV